MTDNKLTTKQLAAEVNEALNELHLFNGLLWQLMICTLEKQNVLPKHFFQQLIEKSAPMHDNPRVAKMLAEFAAWLQEPDAKPAPGWTPRVIEGGRKD